SALAAVDWVECLDCHRKGRSTSTTSTEQSTSTAFGWAEQFDHHRRGRAPRLPEAGAEYFGLFDSVTRTWH
ncbi:hypothetical protein TYRP_022692, partial [Tyrophagus putrescentiae]